MSYEMLGQGPAPYGPYEWKVTPVVKRDQVSTVNQAAAYFAGSIASAKKNCPNSVDGYQDGLNQIVSGKVLGELGESLNFATLQTFKNMLDNADAPCRAERQRKGATVAAEQPPLKPETTEGTEQQREEEGRGIVIIEPIGGVPWWIWLLGAGAVVLFMTGKKKPTPKRKAKPKPKPKPKPKKPRKKPRKAKKIIRIY